MKSFISFIHFIVYPENKDIIVSATEYGEKFCSAIQDKNISGCQFHPEKSHDSGIRSFLIF